MTTLNALKFSKSVMAGALLLAAGLASSLTMAADAGKDQALLIKALAHSKISLIDGLRQSTKLPEAPISAKFEFDDKGKLSLSIYTVEKGLATDAEGNILKELSGSPEQAKWTPGIEVFKDIPHVSRASQQLALMALSPFTLADIAAKAQKQHHGTVFSIKPEVRNRKPVFVVLEADNGKAVELVFGLLDGKRVSAAK